MKRFISVMLVLILVVAIFSGCTGKSGEQSSAATSGTTDATAATKAPEPDYGDTGGLKLPITDKPVTISCIVESEVADLTALVGIQEIEKRTGIKFEMQSYPQSVIEEKRKMRLAAMDLPDLIAGIDRTQLIQLGKDGAVVPINQFTKDLPNFTRLFMEENPWVMKSFSADDGNLYMWPYYNIDRDVNHGFMYRKDIFDKLGIKEWTNTDEFYAALKTLKENYPESVPWTSKTKETIFYDISYGWGIGSANFPMYYNENEKIWKFAGVDPAYKNELDFMKKLYNEGLLDPEFLTTTAADFQAKLTDGRSFVTWDWIGRMSLFKELVKDNIPEYDFRYGNPIGPAGTVRSLPKVNSMGYAVRNNDKKLVTLKLLDYLSSPSGAELATIGIEGVTFEKDAAGNITYPAFPKDKAISFNDLGNKFGVFIMGIYTRVDPRSVYFTYTPNEKEAQDKMINGNKIEIPDPILNFTGKEVESINELKVQLMKSLYEFSAKYVLDKTYSDQQWTDYQKQAEGKGYKQLLDIYNAAQQRYDAVK